MNNAVITRGNHLTTTYKADIKLIYIKNTPATFKGKQPTKPTISLCLKAVSDR